MTAGLTAQALYCDYRTYKINSRSYEELNTIKTIDLVSGELSELSNNIVNNSDEILEDAGVSVDLTSVPEPNPSYEEQFDRFKLLNSDYIGWLGIPGTTIDYPVTQTNNNEYYLTNDFYRNSNQNGCLFVDSSSTNPFMDPITVVHGHHMRDGSMFGNLSLFKNEKYFNEHRTLMFLQRDRLLTYEVFSVFFGPANQEDYKIDFDSKGEYVKHLNRFQDKSLFKADVTPFQPRDRIIVLSTCSYESEENRLLLVARLIK